MILRLRPFLYRVLILTQLRESRKLLWPNCAPLNARCPVDPQEPGNGSTPDPRRKMTRKKQLVDIGGLVNTDGPYSGINQGNPSNSIQTNRSKLNTSGLTPPGLLGVDSFFFQKPGPVSLSEIFLERFGSRLQLRA